MMNVLSEIKICSGEESCLENFKYTFIENYN